MDVRHVFEWLVDGAPGSAGSENVVQRMCDDLVAAGIPLDRFAAFVRTLHPQVMGRAFVWSSGAEVEVKQIPYAAQLTPGYQRSVFAAVKTGPVRRRLLDPATPRDYEPLEDLARDGITDYLAAPMVFLDGQAHLVSFATKAPQGFNQEQLDALLLVTRPLSRLAEILALRRTAANLLDTYVGRNAGERIVSGQIQRGDTDMIRAVIWFSDLRGFTSLAAKVAPTAIIGILNELFDCQVPAIQSHGGEVLKFMGDGLLAIFPTGGADVGEVCESAFVAAEKAREAAGSLNEARAVRGEPPIRFGLALHVGEVAFGNIGGAGRLDFTCIGPAVNIASRLEGLTGKVDRPLVVSEDIAKLTKRRTLSLGAFELKGVPDPQQVYALADSPFASW
jgi:adenylate cyclase